jgi:hypothetical protein
MTPLQQAYFARLRATADANMAFFEKNMATLHRILAREGPSATVDISDQGDLSICYPDGTALPVTEEIMRMEGKLARFANLNDRPQLLAFHKLRDVKDAPSHGDMQRYHYTNLDAEYPNRLRSHFAEYFPDSSGLNRYPSFGEGMIPLLIVLGSGLGWHLSRLVTEYRVKHMIVIDWDVDAFRLSTFYNDYVMLSRLAMERGTNLTFIVQPDIEKISRMLMGVLRKEMPPFFIHGASMFYTTGEDETIQTIREAITETLWEIFFGMGYFDDELISIKHTFDNLKRGYPIYMKPGIVPTGAIAFIVGSGPSLDGLLPLLRANADRAVVFSCGTALSALVNAGIKPDYHVEKERPYIVYEVLTKTVGHDYLKGLKLLGLNVVHPDVFELFDSQGIILKAADTMAVLMHRSGAPLNVILNTQPTVTNTAIDFALSAGFRAIYLFGVDMGYKDKERHHSQNTAYLQKMPDADHLKRLLSKRPKSDIEVPGNFGGVVATNKILQMARRQMGYAVTTHPASKVYNLNDGAAIDGAIPHHVEDFAASSTPETKQEAMQAMSAAFETRTFDVTELKNELLGDVDTFIDEVSSCIKERMVSREDVLDKLGELYQLVRKKDEALLPTGSLFRGFVYHLMSLTFNALSIIKDEEEAVAKAMYDLRVLEDGLDQARKEIIAVLTESE